MIDINSWSRSIPSSIIPSNSSNIPVQFISCDQVADATNLLQFTIGSKSFNITYPYINNNTILINGNEYICITRIIKPPITNIGIGRDKVVTINGVYELPIVFYVPNRKNNVVIRWGQKFYWQGIRNTDLIRYRSFMLTPYDREWIDSRSSITTSRSDNTIDIPYICGADLKYCYSLFNSKEDITDIRWNWKHITQLRFLDIEDSYLAYIRSRLHWLHQPNVENDNAQRLFNRFWTSNPQVQYLDPMSSDIARIALTSKVHFPISRFDPLEFATPDPSWMTYLCSLSTPQSDRAGEIIAVASDAEVVDGRIRYKEKL